MKDLNKLYKEVLDDIYSLDIPIGNIWDIRPNARYKKTWGLCQRLVKHGVNGFEITIATSLLDDKLDDMAAKETIAHELLHTIEGCLNHGPKWKKYADLMSVFGYRITRASSCADKGIDPNQHIAYKYAIYCKNCGHTCYYSKRTKIVSMIFNGETKNLRCGKCKSHDLFAKTL